MPALAPTASAPPQARPDPGAPREVVAAPRNGGVVLAVGLHVRRQRLLVQAARRRKLAQILEHRGEVVAARRNGRVVLAEGLQVRRQRLLQQAARRHKLAELAKRPRAHRRETSTAGQIRRRCHQVNEAGGVPAIALKGERRISCLQQLGCPTDHRLLERCRRRLLGQGKLSQQPVHQVSPRSSRSSR